MKKTLIALAALGVVGAASAQVTISGDLSYGFRGSKVNATNVVTDGFGMRTSNITFSVSEDLGGGLTVSGSMGMDGVNSSTAITGNSGSLSLSGGFGTLTMLAAEESANGIIGNSAGVNIADMDIGFKTAASSTDALVYDMPAMNGVTASVAVFNDTAGFGTGTHLQSIYTVGYATGPLSAKVDMTDYTAAGKSNRTRINASYDLGMAKFTIGNSRGGVTSGKNDQTVWGISVPMGAVTLGVGSASANTGTKVTASGVSATYAMSKQTSVVFSTATASGTIPTAGDKKRTEIYIKKAF